METLILIAYVISGIISIAFAIRWWKTMSRVKEIRDHFIVEKEVPKLQYEVKSPVNIDQNELDALVAKLKSNQCVVLVKKTSRLETWSKSDWDEIIMLGRENLFSLLHKNF